MLNSCRACRVPLEPGGPQSRSAETARFRVLVKSLPVQRCSRGCPGFYWSHLDLGVDAFDLLVLSENFAAVKGLFRSRQACRGCGGSLNPSERRDFYFGPDASSLSPLMTITITGESLSCSPCRKHFLPGKLYRGDPLYIELDDAVGAAMTRDLFSQ